MLFASEGAHDRWTPWIDPLLLEWLREGGGTQPAERPVDAALTLIDISGFTALTDRLMQSGPAGAEHVKDILDRTFGVLTGLVAAFGGKTLTFPGDAVLAIWPAPREDLHQRVRQAAVYALHAIPSLKELSLPHTTSPLSGRGVVVSGQVRVLFVGGIDGRWDCLVDGEPLWHLAEALASARPGDIVVSEPARMALTSDTDFPVTRLHTGLHLLRPWSREALDAGRPIYRAPPSAPLGPLPPSVVTSVPTAVFDHVQADGPDRLAQFRLVTALFVRLAEPGVPPLPMEQVHRNVQRLHVEAARFGGVVNQTVVDDKGTIAVLAWGLSGSAHEDNATRAVLAAMSILSAADTESGMSIGIATGRVFTGSRGSSERLEYAMIGHSVNLAARLMQQARGSILCDDATRAAARTRVAFESVATPAASGGQARVRPAYRPLKTKDQRQAGFDGLVGRKSELALLLEAFRRLEAGNPGGAIVIEGEPGIGKSRLVASLVAHTQGSHVRSLIVRGDPVERSPYHAWRAPLERLLGLGGRTIDDQRSRLLHLLGASRGPSAPLLSEVLGIQFVETEATRRMSPQGRADETRELLFHLFSEAVRNTPTLLVLEDAHWFDSGSWALADALVKHISPLLCIVAMRPMPGDDLDAGGVPFLAGCDVRLLLDSLDQDDALALACQCLDADLMPGELSALVWDKARGHPFYVEQLVLALRDAGLLHVDRGDCQLRGDAAAALSRSVPETVQGIVTSRVDRLTPAQQLTLKVASVVGLDFDLSLVATVSPDRATPEVLRRDLEAMAKLGLLTRNTVAGPEAYSFKHAITLQVTYDLLPFAQRRRLHAAVASQLEADGSATHALLAHHWIEAGVPDKAFDHLVAAGEASLRGDANREAAEIFRQALGIDLSTCGLPPDRVAFQRARCHRLLAQALWVIGMFADMPGEIEASFRLLGGREHWVRSRYGLLVTQLAVQAWHLLAGPAIGRRQERRREQRLELSRAASLLATLRASPRDTVALLADSLLTLNLAEQAGSTNVVALGLLGYTADAVGLRRLSNTYFDRARTRAQELGELSSYALALLFECMARFGAGDHVRAAALLHEGLDVARELNDRRALARAADLLSVTHSFTFAESAAESMRHVTEAIDSIRDRPVADRTYFLMTLRALSAQLLRPHAARSIFEPLEEMVDPSFAHCTADAAALMHAANALFHVRQGEIDAAVAAADAAFTWGRRRLRELPPSGWVFFEGPIEAYLAAAAAAEHGSGTFLARVRRAGDAVATLARYARRCPIYGPRARHFEARLALVERRPDRARAKWEEASTAAARLGLVLDEGRAQVHLAALASNPAVRRQHLARARALFAPARADFFMDWLEQEEAGDAVAEVP